MNINLQNLLNQNSSSTNTSNAGQLPEMQTNSSQSTQAAYIRQLLEGQTFSGQITNINTSTRDIQIILGDNSLLQAKLQNTMNLNLGDIITFEIKEKTASQIFIKPIEVQEMPDAIVSKVLQSSGLSKNSKNMAIVKELISQNMPVDKQALLNTIKNVTSNPQAPLNQIVFMQKQGIEITENSIRQFAGYEKGEHQLLNQLNLIADNVLESFSQPLNEESQVKLLDLYAQLNKAFSQSPSAKPDMLFLTTAQSEKLLNFLNNLVQPEKVLLSPEKSGEQEVSQLLQNGKAADSMNSSVHTIPRELQEQIALLKEGAASKTINPQEFQGRVSELLNILQAQGILNSKELHNLFKSDVFRDIFQEQMRNSLLINPQELLEAEQKDKFMKEAYSRIEETAEKLERIFEQLGKGDNALLNSCKDLKSNLNMMQTINQFFPYTQFPLKFEHYNGHGDLYIYKRSQEKNQNKETLSAFLHLDLEHLGAADIDIRMTGKSVKTAFTLKEKSSMDLVEKNLPLLKDRLEKRGFTVEYSISSGQEEKPDTNLINEISKNFRPKLEMKRYTFDVRM